MAAHDDLMRPEGRKMSRLRQNYGGVGFLSDFTCQAQSDQVSSSHKNRSLSFTSGFALHKE